MRIRSIAAGASLAALLLSGSANGQDTAALVRQCDMLASSPADEQKPADIEGVGRGDIDKDKAIPACEAALAASPDEPRMAFNLGRVLDATKTDMPRSAELYERAAQKDYVVAMLNLGVAYENGLGKAKDVAQAVIWYRKAAEKGQVIAATNLGVILDEGRGVPPDPAEARKWFEFAVSKGDVQAMTSLGWMYDRGVAGLPMDHVKANELYQKAMEGGDLQGMENFGESLIMGEGVAKDVARGLQLVQQAHDGGNGMATYNLARYHATGENLSLDRDQAAQLYLQALERNSADAKRELIEKRGRNLDPAMLKRLQDEMGNRGMAFDRADDALSDSAVAALQGIVQE